MFSFYNLCIASLESEYQLDGISGACLELSLKIEVEDATELGVKVRCSLDKSEQTAVVYVPNEKTLKVDMSESSLNENIRYYYYRNHGALGRLPENERIVQAQKAPFEPYPGETLNLRIFLDNSVLEVFANKRQSITQRIYPTRSDSLETICFCRGGGIKVKSVEAWDMDPALS